MTQEKRKIRALTDISTFWEDVRQIIGFYDGKFWKDYQIKDLQRTADTRFEELERGL